VRRSKAAVVLGLWGGGYGGDKGAGGFAGAFKGECQGSRGGALGERPAKIAVGVAQPVEGGGRRGRQVGPDYQRERAVGMTEKRRKAAGMTDLLSCFLSFSLFKPTPIFLNSTQI
jgi:hypothetical protein